MKKKGIILTLTAVSALIGMSLYFASRLSKLLDLDIFDIEEDDF